MTKRKNIKKNSSKMLPWKLNEPCKTEYIRWSIIYIWWKTMSDTLYAFCLGNQYLMDEILKS